MTAKPRQTVMHVEPISATAAAARMHHARGAVRSAVTEHAKATINPAAAERGIVDLGSATQDEIERDSRERAAWVSGRRGPKPEPYVEFLIAGPPQYCDAERVWDADKEDRWAQATLAWVRSRFPRFARRRRIPPSRRDRAARPHHHFATLGRRRRRSLVWLVSRT